MFLSRALAHVLKHQPARYAPRIFVSVNASLKILNSSKMNEFGCKYLNSHFVRMQHSTSNPAGKDKPELQVKFKTRPSLADRFKEGAKQYGPIFVVVHIALSLVSVGFFYIVVTYAVNPIDHLPPALVEKLSAKMTSATNEGGTMVIAYALHKLIFPLRLTASMAITPYLSKKVYRLKYFKKP